MTLFIFCKSLKLCTYLSQTLQHQISYDLLHIFTKSSVPGNILMLHSKVLHTKNVK